MCVYIYLCLCLYIYLYIYTMTIHIYIHVNIYGYNIYLHIYVYKIYFLCSFSMYCTWKYPYLHTHTHTVSVLNDRTNLKCSFLVTVSFLFSFFFLASKHVRIFLKTGLNVVFVFLFFFSGAFSRKVMLPHQLLFTPLMYFCNWFSSWLCTQWEDLTGLSSI